MTTRAIPAHVRGPTSRNECKHLMLNEKTLRYLGLSTQRQLILGAQENAGRGCSGLLVGITHLGLGEFEKTASSVTAGSHFFGPESGPAFD